MAAALARSLFQEGLHGELLVTLAPVRTHVSGLPLHAQRSWILVPKNRLGSSRVPGHCPLLAPAACWWARTTVPSPQCGRQSRSGRVADRLGAARRRSRTPACCQYRKRLSTVFQLP